VADGEATRADAIKVQPRLVETSQPVRDTEIGEVIKQAGIEPQ
jgi:hypothetical protein